MVRDPGRRKVMPIRLFAGGVSGAAVGLAVYHLAGCPTGGCPLTGSPLATVLYGTLIGVLVTGGL